MITRSMLNSDWLNPLYYSFIGCHLLMFIGFGFVNRGLPFLLLKKYMNNNIIKEYLEWGSSSDNTEETAEKPKKVAETNGKSVEVQKLI